MLERVVLEGAPTCGLPVMLSVVQDKGERLMVAEESKFQGTVIRAKSLHILLQFLQSISIHLRLQLIQVRRPEWLPVFGLFQL